MTSIIQKETECYFCFRTWGLHKHHCLHGSANRIKSEQDGLTVYLCAQCHGALHDKGTGDRQLMQLAQTMWERHYGDREAFRERYGKSYL